MAKVETYQYSVRHSNGGSQTIELSFQEAWNLAYEIKRDVDPYGTWGSTDD